MADNSKLLLRHLKTTIEKTKADYEKKIAGSLKSAKVEGNTVKFYTTSDKTGAEAFSFDFPAELFLDQTKTTFVPMFAFSAETYPDTTDPSLEGKPVMVLAVKGSSDTVTYSFLDMTKLVDTYTANEGDGSATVTVSGYEISVSVNISDKQGNQLQKDEKGNLYVPAPASIDLSGKMDKVVGGTEGHTVILDANGNVVDSGSGIATDEEVNAMLNELFPAE